MGILIEVSEGKVKFYSGEIGKFRENEKENSVVDVIYLKKW